jgi:hypothetical protein
MSTAPFPSLSEVIAWNSAYLDDAVTHWNKAADKWDDAYSQTYRQAQRPGGTEWIGAAADAAVEKVGSDRLAVVRAADTLREAARNAQSGSSRLSFARQRVLNSVAEAEEAGFNVGEDYSVTSVQSGGGAAARAARDAQALAFASRIHVRLAELMATDEEVASAITTAANGVQLLGFSDRPIVRPGEDKPTVQGVSFFGPLPERPKLEPDPPPGGWSDDPVTRAAQKIAYGHAFGEHGAREFPGLSKDELARIVDDMFRRASGDSSGLLVGRTADGAPVLYDPKTNIIIIRDPKALDCGTVYRPNVPNLSAYLDGKVPTRVGSLPPDQLSDGPISPVAPRPPGPRLPDAPVEPPRPAPEVTKAPPVRGGPLPGAPQFVPVPGLTAGREPPVIGSLGQEPDLPETGVEP